MTAQASPHRQAHGQTHAHLHGHGGDAHRRPWASILVLFAAGAYFTYTILSGNLANYVNVGFAWLSWLAAGFLFLFGAVKLLDRAPAVTHSHYEMSGGCCGRVAGWKLCMLAIPLALGFFIPSRPLDASSIGDQPDFQAMLMQHVDMHHIVTAETVEKREWLYSLYNDFMPDKPRTYNDPLLFTLVDWLRLFYDTKDKTVLEGEPVNMVGFVYQEASPVPDRFMLTRFFMRHCMFDTIPVGMPVLWKHGDAFTQDSWVQVRGHLTYAENASGERVLSVQAEDVRLTQQPATPYLYPHASAQ